MSTAKRILENAHPTCSQLDSLIRNMETQMGIAHSTSPFTALYQKHGFSAQIPQPPKPEESKEESAQQQPKKQKKEKAPADADAPKKQEKKEKQPKANNQKAAADDETPAGMSEEMEAFWRSDLRVGRILSATRHPDSDKLYVEKIDLGEGRERTIGSGLQLYVPIE